MAAKKKTGTAGTFVCVECGGRRAVMKTLNHVTVVGAFKVKNCATMVAHCAKCNHAQMTLDVLAQLENRAAAIVLREATPIDGAVVKFARHALGLTQPQLGTVLSLKPETLSRYEHNKLATPRPLQLALVALLDSAYYRWDCDPVKLLEHAKPSASRVFKIRNSNAA